MAIRAFRVSDLRHEGGYLYPLVLRYLTDKIAPRLFTDSGPARLHYRGRAQRHGRVDGP